MDRRRTTTPKINVGDSSRAAPTGNAAIGSGGTLGRPQQKTAGGSRTPQGATASGARRSDQKDHRTVDKPLRNDNQTGAVPARRDERRKSSSPVQKREPGLSGAQNPPVRGKSSGSGDQNPPVTKGTGLVDERRIAELLVQRASVVTEIVWARLNQGNNNRGGVPTSSSSAAPISQYKPPTAGGKGSGVVKVKQDETPVTIADYAVQALLMWALKSYFPKDLLLGEEDAEGLKNNKEMLAKICGVIKEAQIKMDEEWAKEVDAWVREGNRAESFHKADKDLPWPTTADEVLAALNFGVPRVFGLDGNGKKEKKEKTVKLESGKRYWIMDPVDGTSAFLQNGQYAIMLALVRDCKEILGVCACPNTSYYKAVERKGIKEYMVVSGKKKKSGVMLAAVKGHGVTMRELGRTKLLPSMQKLDWSSDPVPSFTKETPNGPPDFSNLTFIDSGESPKTLSAVVKALAGKSYDEKGIQGYSSHWRYAVGAILGPGTVQVRCPNKRKCDWKIWDHVGTVLIYEESGAGIVTDMAGKPLDYSQRPVMAANWGVIAAHRSVHKEIREAAQGLIRQEKIAKMIEE